ncbi:hypothetical protein EX895_000971 [Sporisorium graminicola]|uniref:DH domain-containing protein n=1 Tax=Sporisorium graminicola TaxID=280036 RepID=A0A4U7L603_9BASI|nr:hypothetical protein EX895_000971 [Sporisorium graminicola]TKY90972.1 hypothetical protein EX895_000971 [Sporisorium graminicola]
MSTSQLTPRAKPIPLLSEKSLPSPPPPSPSPSSRPPSSDAATHPAASTSYAAKTIKALPARPTFPCSWAESASVEGESSADSVFLTHALRSRSSGSTASFLDFGPDTPESQLFARAPAGARPGTAPHLTQRQRVDSFKDGASIATSSPTSSPPQEFYSPRLMPESPRSTIRSAQSLNMSSGSPSSSVRRAARPSLPTQWKTSPDSSKNPPAAPPRLSSVESAKLFEPSPFPPAGSQHGHSGQSSPASQRLSSHHTRFSSDYSVRDSSSTQTSLWTERSMASCATSPACAQYALFASDDAAGHVATKGGDICDTTEELDEDSVGLGITSDFEHDTSSRRSSAAPVLPSPMLPGSAKAMQGPFSHHRAPSWTRRVDVSPFSGLPSQSYANGEGGLRPLGSNVSPSMQRALSDVTPVSSAGEDIAAAVASVSSSTSVNLDIPLRRDSRIRCSSDSASYRQTTYDTSKHLHSPALSNSSSASNSGRFTPGLPPMSSNSAGIGNLSVLQSPPRTTSLHYSPSARSMRGSPKSGSPLTPPAQSPGCATRRPARPTLDRITTICDLSNSIIAVPSTPDTESEHDSPIRTTREPSLRTSSAASRARRVSDASINSFLQNGEFSHIVGAYTSRMRWEEGLYDFDESAELDGDESRAVQTAEDGSATIVQGSDLTLAQIEAETGPNTTHLLLSCNQTEGLAEVLERMLPQTTNLLVLDLSNCGLQRLPDAIGACIALEELDISGNPADHLPDWILNLRALRILSADRIGLHHLPSSLIQLQVLQRLSIRNNQLVFLPSWLYRMSKLNNLFVEGNHFRGPWQDIVAPLLSQAPEPLERSSQPAQAQQIEHAPSMQVCSSSANHFNLQQVSERPLMARMRSANDLQSMLSGPFGSSTPPASTPDFQSDDSGHVSPKGAQSRPTTAYEDRITRLSFADEADSHTPGGGKWGGFLKKIGRKASSQRLGVAYNDHTTSPSESRFSSPKASRKSLRSSNGAARSNSISRSGAAAAATTPSQSEPICPSIVEVSRSLAQAVGENPVNRNAPMTPLEAPSRPRMLPEPVRLLQPFHSDSDAKKARRRSFLPVQAFANAAAAAVPITSELKGSTAAPSSSQEMDEESLAMHRNRLRALMHYLRDLDDLTAARSEATSVVGPSKSALAHLRDANGSSRRPSMHRAESSNPSTKSRDSGGEYVISTAASSISEGASSEPARLSTARCSKDDSVRRFRIIAEIVSTERTYVKGLGELVDIYAKPAMAPADGNSGVPVIPPGEHRAVFGNVEALLQFHRTVFLPSLVAMARPVLEHDQDSPGDMAPEETAAVAEKVASVFSTHAAFFKMYTSYINNCDSAQDRISAWMATTTAGNGGGLSLRGASGYSALQAFGALSAQQGAATAIHANGMISANSASGLYGSDTHLSPSQRKKIKTFMKRCRTHPRHTQLNVESYLLLPVQRIPRYRLLLEDLVKSTDTTRLADGDALAMALEHVTQIASKVNESKRQSEQDRRLLAWQYRIRGHIEGPLVQPHRRLLKDGSLQLKRVVRRIPGFVRCNRSASDGSAEQRQSYGALSPAQVVSGQNHVLSADHLQQVTENQSMSLILCSDVAVLCTEQARSKDANAPVLLRSMLKLIRPVEVLGGVNLRIVDRSEILYLAASSPEEAVAWKTAFDLHFYQ